MTWQSPIVTAEPAVEPVSIEEARAHLNIAEGDDTFDTELNIYIKAARGHVENHCGIKLINQTVSLKASSWCDLERLPVAPVTAIASVKYLDTDGAEQTLDSAVYETNLEAPLQPEVRLKVNQTWPAIRCVRDAIRLVGTAGYGAAAAAVPEPIRQALLLMIGDWFRNREDSTAERLTELPRGAAALLADYRL